MKKIYLVFILLFVFNAVNAQNEIETNQQKNEIKLNVLSPLIGVFEATYERNLNTKSSVGISGLYVFNDKSEDDMNYSLSTYYRRYFGKKIASGFFVEGFGMFSSLDGKKIYDPIDNTKFTENPDVYDLSLGIGLGNKWVTKSGFVFEVNVGWGKLLFNADKTDHTQVARFGFHVGKRF